MPNYLKKQDDKVELKELKKLDIPQEQYINRRPTIKSCIKYMTNYRASKALVEDGSVTTIVGSVKDLDRDQLLKWVRVVFSMYPDEFDVCIKTQTYRIW